jgi:hypothetical protein
MLAVTVYFTTRVYWVSLALVVFLLFLVPDFASSGRFLGFFFWLRAIVQSFSCTSLLVVLRGVLPTLLFVFS